MVMMRTVLLAVACVLAAGVTMRAGAMGADQAKQAVVLAEAEAFGQRGGWVVDQQFMDEMGSPFLLAHGLGAPVADANTTVPLPGAGTYRVWVRTRDWVWMSKAPGSAYASIVSRRNRLPHRHRLTGRRLHRVRPALLSRCSAGFGR